MRGGGGGERRTPLPVVPPRCVCVCARERREPPSHKRATTTHHGTEHRDRQAVVVVVISSSSSSRKFHGNSTGIRMTQSTTIGQKRHKRHKQLTMMMKIFSTYIYISVVSPSFLSPLVVACASAREREEELKKMMSDM